MPSAGAGATFEGCNLVGAAGNSNSLSQFLPSRALSLLHQLPCEEAPAKDQVTFKEYLAHISQLHQCLSMSMQIQGDLPNTNHKYMAHQVALLYQTLSYQNLKCSAFKKVRTISEQLTHTLLAHTHSYATTLSVSPLSHKLARAHTRTHEPDSSRQPMNHVSTAIVQRFCKKVE